MGVTIHLQGVLRDERDVPRLVHELVDIAETLRWRHDVVESDELNGVGVTPHERCETLLLLFDRDGVLRNPVLLAEGDAWSRTVAVKTQYAPVETHECLVKLLRHLEKRYFDTLEVHDEGEFWDTGDRKRLVALRERVAAATERVVGALEANPTPSEESTGDGLVGWLVEILAQLDAESGAGAGGDRRERRDDLVRRAVELRNVFLATSLPEDEVLRSWDVDDWADHFERHDRARSRLLEAMAEQPESLEGFAAALRKAEADEAARERVWDLLPEHLEKDAERLMDRVGEYGLTADDDGSMEVEDEEDYAPWHESLPEYLRKTPPGTYGASFDDLVAEFPAVERALDFHAGLDRRLRGTPAASSPPMQYIMACLTTTFVGISMARYWARDELFLNAEPARWLVTARRFATVARVLERFPVPGLDGLERQAREIASAFETMAGG